MRVAVTGAAGKLGSAVVADLTDHGYEVAPMDIAGGRENGILRVSFTDFGETVDALADSRADAIAHFAAIPGFGIASEVSTFQNNMLSTFNVLQAARRLGIRNIVYTSSETVQGVPYSIQPPYLPLDESYPARPESVYALVKHLEETMCRELTRWDEELKIIALRVSNVKARADYAEFRSFQRDANTSRMNLWSYIDARDGAQAVRKALEYRAPGFDCFVIANSDTVMERESRDLAAEYFPDVEIRTEFGGNASFLSSERARLLLGFRPEHPWREQV